MMAYLVEMAVRLVELHRVLKPTGSLYLHCDPTASHYLKLVLDAIFGADKFRKRDRLEAADIAQRRCSGRKALRPVAGRTALLREGIEVLLDSAVPRVRPGIR